jgi:phytanoyl-CoA hydroxylase
METISLSEEKPLCSRDLKRLRRHAAKVFERLEEKIHGDCNDGSPPPPSWVEGDIERNNSKDITDDHNKNQNYNEQTEEASFRKRYFDDYGFWVARGFCDSKQASDMKQAMGDSVKDHWFPEGTSEEGNDNEETTKTKQQQQQQQKVTSFGTDAKANEARGDPFLESADKVSYFAEPTALDPESGCLKQEFRDRDNKMFALCKAGHGIHLPPSFRRVETSEGDDEKKTNNKDDDKDDDEDDNHKKKNAREPFFEYTSSSKLRELVLSLGYRDPVVPQSMYIFKNPKLGGAVHSHQDSTFLYTTPRQTCLGLWLALDDATLQNGCLWVRPRSHREPVRRQFLRNPKHQTDDDTEPKLTFEKHHENPEVTWEGSLPESVNVASGDDDDVDHEENESDGTPKKEPEISSMNFVPVEVNAGDLVVFCGTLDHFSLPNFSEEQRHTFQLHLVEGPNVGIRWSPSNWLQYESSEETTEQNEFLRLLDYANET